MPQNNKTDLYHVLVENANPHHVAAQMADDPDSPFADEHSKPYVHGSSIVAVWAAEHLTPAQQTWLDNHPNCTDVRHVDIG